MTSSRGLLCAWLRVPPERDEEFNAWYDTEHLQQISSIEGISRGRRYCALDGSRWYLAMYDLQDAQVIEREPFGRVINNPTPWSRRMRTLYGPDRIRVAHERLLDWGAPPLRPPPCVFVVRMNIPADQELDFNRWYDEEHAARMAAVPGVLHVQRLRAIEGPIKYATVYALAESGIPAGEAWKQAAESPWTQKMRSAMTDLEKREYAFLSAVP